MSTKYFLLTKDENTPVTENAKNQIVFLNNDLTFILPEINLDYYYKFGLFESGIMEWAKQLCSKTDVFLDIGAHTGTYSLAYSNYCCQVYAFEPQKMTFYALCGSVALSNKRNISCLNIGLGSPEQVGKATLKIRSLDGGGSSFCQIQGANILAEETAQIETLDEFSLKNIPENQRIGLIKMDVEYNELNVLKGSISTIQKHRPKILFEANPDGAMNSELFSFLEKSLKYRIISLTGTDNMFLAEYSQ